MSLLKNIIVAGALVTSSTFLGCSNQPKGLKSADQLLEEIVQFRTETLNPAVQYAQAETLFKKVQDNLNNKEYFNIEPDINQVLHLLEESNHPDAQELERKANSFSYQRTFVYSGNSMVPVLHIAKGQEAIIVEYTPAIGSQKIIRDDKKQNLQTMLQHAQAETTQVVIEKPVYIDRIVEKPVEKIVEKPVIVEKEVIKYRNKPKNKDPMIAELEDDANYFLTTLNQMIKEYEADGKLELWEKNALNMHYNKNIIDLKYYSVHSNELMKCYAKAQNLKREHFAK